MFFKSSDRPFSAYCSNMSTLVESGQFTMKAFNVFGIFIGSQELYNKEDRKSCKKTVDKALDLESVIWLPMTGPHLITLLLCVWHVFSESYPPPSWLLGGTNLVKIMHSTVLFVNWYSSPWDNSFIWKII